MSELSEIMARINALPPRPSEDGFIRGEPVTYHDFQGRRCIATRMAISGVPTLRIRVRGGKRAKEFFMSEDEARSFYRNLDRQPS